MQNLRRAHRLIWFALTWFALSIGAMAAAAAINPQAIELICSTSHRSKMVANGDGGAPVAGHHLGDCPLCVTAGAPPPVLTPSVPHRLPADAPAVVPIAYVATQAAVPPPARGPPSI